MFSLKLLALVGIVLLVAASTIAFWPASAPAEEKIADIGPEQEIVQVAAGASESGSGFSFDAGKPTSEGIQLNDSVTATSVQAIGNGPLKVTLANVATGQNLIAMASG